MLQNSRRQISGDAMRMGDGETALPSPSVRKIDFSASGRKKAQTPKKKAPFTPLRPNLDMKPKMEPESPSAQKRSLNIRSEVLPAESEDGPAMVKVETMSGCNVETTHDETRPASSPAQIDVKPNVDDLEALLGGLDLDRPGIQTPNGRTTLLKEGPTSWTPVIKSIKKSSCTPLFLPNDSPTSSASYHSPVQSPGSLSDAFNSPPRSEGEIADQRTTNAGSSTGFGLFSDDSPPPAKREVWSPAASRSSNGEDDRRLSPSPSQSSRCSSPRRSDTARSALNELPVAQSVAVHAGPSRNNAAKRRAFLDFLNKIEQSESEGEIEGRYRDDDSGSLGSLKDFIVDDDDDVEYCSDESQDEDEEFAAPPSRRSQHHTQLEVPTIYSDDSDLEEIKETRVLDTKRASAPTLPIKVESNDSEAQDSDFAKDVVDASLLSPIEDEDSDDDDSPEDLTRPSIGPVMKSGTFLDDFIDSDDDSTSTVGDDEDALADALDGLDLRATTPSRSKGKARKPHKAPKWDVERVRIAQEVFDDLDKRVFESRLGPDGAGAKIVWNKRLLTTAGTAQRKKRRQSDGSTSWEVGIQLSEKVCTGEEQILSTVAHEMCHLACWIIDNEFKNPHGKVFKSWGRKVMRKRSDLEVTTKHDYIIEYKYKWQCAGCKKVYKRHSKSIDIEKQGCGICRGKLEPMFETKQRVSNPFQLYLKQNMATAKSALPGASHGEVMRALSARWAEAGPAADHAGHWKAVLAASRS